MFLSPLNTCLSADIPNPPRKRSSRKPSTPTSQQAISTLPENEVFKKSTPISPQANPKLLENEVFKHSTLNTYLSAGRLNTPENEVFKHSTLSNT